MPTEYFISASDPSLQGLATRSNGTFQALTPAIVRNDVLPRRIHVMEEGPEGKLRHRVIAGATLEVALGIPDLGPSGGTFALTFNGSGTGLTVLAYNITAAALETALNANAEVAVVGGVDVTGTAPVFIITFRTVGNKSEFVVDAANLEPSCTIDIDTTEPGAAGTREVQVIRLLRRVFAYSSNWSVVSDPSTAVPTLTSAGSATTKGVIDLALPEFAESGSFRLDFSRIQSWAISVTGYFPGTRQTFFLSVGTPGGAGDYGGVFFDTEDKNGLVRVWLDYNNTSTPPSTPTGGRLLEVDYNSISAAVILAAIKAKFNADAEFAGTINFTSTQLLVVQTAWGTRVDPPATVVGASAGATITMSVSTAGTNGELGGKYLPLADNAGTVAVWFNVHNDIEPAHGADRSIAVDASSFTTAALIRTGLSAALDADSEFTSSVSGTKVLVTDFSAGTRDIGALLNTSRLPVAVTTIGAGISGEFPFDVNAAELETFYGDYFFVTAAKPGQFRFVAKANGTWANATAASNFVVPTYFDGTINLNGANLHAAFAELDADSDSIEGAFLTAKYTTPAGAKETILRMAVPIYRSVLDDATLAGDAIAGYLVNGENIPVPPGAVGAPGAFIVGDTDTGLYQAAPDSLGITLGGVAAASFTATQLIFRTDGSSRVFIDSTGVISTVGFLSNHATQGMGYATGAGGTVTQLTSKSTGVTLNKATGNITLHNEAMDGTGGMEIKSFILTNSAIAATDFVSVQHVSGGTLGNYDCHAAAASGSATIYVRLHNAGPFSEAIVLKFVVIKAVTA